MATFQEVFGDGSDGAYTGGPLVKGQTYNFTSFYLDTAITLGAGDGKKIVIKCQGDFEITSSGSITSNADASVKDNSSIIIDGHYYNVIPAYGPGGIAGVGGLGSHDGTHPEPTYVVPKGGNGGSARGNGYKGEPPYTVYYAAEGGAGGIAIGGAGGNGKNAGSNDQAGAGGGGAGGGGGNYQNGIIIFAYRPINLAGSITGHGSNATIPGGSGGNSSGHSNDNEGGGGGGGAGGGGNSGIKVKLYSFLPPVGDMSINANGGSGSAGGAGGIAISKLYSTPQVAQDGTAGTAGGVGPDGMFEASIINELVTGKTIIYGIFASQVQADSSVASDGGAAITERGFVFAETSSPTTADNKELVSGTTGEMSATIDSLNADTTYYIRSFATNSAGTAYGEETSFTTIKGFVPKVIIGG